MKRLATHPKSLFFGVFFILCLMGLPAGAQSQNLLTNPGFENPFTPFTDAVPTRYVAQGWSPWYIGGGQSASENVYPEYYPASNVSDALGVPRIRSGSDAQQYLSFFATHDAGVFQRVTGLTPGAQLRFSAYVYVWSTSFDDVNVSELDGGVNVQVGIDPTGGTSAESANVVWSAPVGLQYDAYNEYSVTATIPSTSTAATVFVRTTVSAPVKNNNIYVDDASLIVVNGATNTPQLPSPTVTNTSVPPTATHTISPSATPESTALPIPVATNTPDDLGIVTPTLPSETAVPAATNTLPPTATFTVQPTNTEVPPTATFTLTPTVPPTNTPVPVSPTPTQEAMLPTPTVPGGTPISNEFPGQVFHTVRAGDVVYNLAILYGSSPNAIIAANGLNSSGFIQVGQVLVIPVRLAAPATVTPSVTPNVPIPPTSVVQPPNTIVYIVQPGDTLGRIAARFNTTVTTLAQLNGIANINLIRIGQQLQIPSGSVPPNPVPPPQQTTYIVRPGDTLFRIALRHGVPLYLLAQVNGIANPNLVYVGQVLVIP
jgi:LysM repeat protein